VVSLPEVRRAAARDPRFDPIAEGRLDEVKARKVYAFLEEYRDREIADLKAQLKKTKDVSQKEVIKKEIMSMESRKKARRAKEDEEKLLAEHKKKEKELVAQGKKPFYLKKSDQKKQLLTHRYESMSKGQVDKSIQRKRKKVAGREKKELDFMQRVTDRRNR
jgi:ribosomal RNA-processing protein 36